MEEASAQEEMLKRLYKALNTIVPTVKHHKKVDKTRKQLAQVIEEDLLAHEGDEEEAEDMCRLLSEKR